MKKDDRLYLKPHTYKVYLVFTDGMALGEFLYERIQWCKKLHWPKAYFDAEYKGGRFVFHFTNEKTAAFFALKWTGG